MHLIYDHKATSLKVDDTDCLRQVYLYVKDEKFYFTLHHHSES